MIYEWSITETQVQEGLILCAKYHVIAKEDDLSVETEGYWTFDNPKMTIPFDQVTEEMVVGWIDAAAMKDGKSVIKSRLEEQLNNKKQPVPAPWMPQVFTPNI